jgi:S1-C subfamily serine protease
MASGSPKICATMRSQRLQPMPRTPGLPLGCGRAALLICALLWGCAQPGGTPGGSTPAPPAGPPAAAAPPLNPALVTRFGPERSAQVRQELEAKGWSLLSAMIRRTDPPGSGFEVLSFVDPASVVRTGSQVRVRMLTTHAKPIGTLGSAIVFQQADCQARTLRTMAQDHFSDTTATVRIATSNQASAAAPVLPNSLGEVLLNSVCAGRFAGVPQRPGAPPAGVARMSTGSGVVMATQRVLTNAHVVANCKTLDVLMAGQKYSATVRKRDAASDLALLDVKDLPAGPSPRLRRQALTGEAVMAAGYPLAGLLGTDLVVTDGIVNALSGLGNSTRHLQMSAAIQPGNSGGPLLDRSGNLVGLVVAKLNAVATMALTGDIPQNVNFAIKPEFVAQFLSTESLALGTPADPGVALDTQQLASRAGTFTVKVECRP